MRGVKITPGESLNGMRKKEEQKGFGLQEKFSSGQSRTHQKIPKRQRSGQDSTRVDPLQRLPSTEPTSLGKRSTPKCCENDNMERMNKMAEIAEQQKAGMSKRIRSISTYNKEGRSSLDIRAIHNIPNRPQRSCTQRSLPQSHMRMDNRPGISSDNTSKPTSKGKPSRKNEISEHAHTVAQNLPAPARRPSIDKNMREKFQAPPRAAPRAPRGEGRRRKKLEPKEGSADAPLIIDDDDDDDAAPTAQQKPRPEIPPVSPFRRQTRRMTRSSSGRHHVHDIDNDEHYLQYPCGARAVDAVNITKGDLCRLEDTEFLNDNLVDFYLKFLTTDASRSPLFRDNPLTPEALKSQVHVFSSHFFTKLTEIKITTRTFQEAHKRVERWTRRLDIFKLKFIMVPVVQQLHWSLAVICHPDRIVDMCETHINHVKKKGTTADDAVDIDVDDEDEEIDPEQPCVVFMDSLKMHKENEVFKAIKAWLCEEYRKKKGKDIQCLFETKKIPLIADLKLPRQKNGWDCGLFVLRYARELLSSLFLGDGPQLRISAKAHSERFAHFDFASWFRQADITRMRKEVKVLIKSLREEHDWFAQLDQAKQAKEFVVEENDKIQHADEKDIELDNNAITSNEDVSSSKEESTTASLPQDTITKNKTSVPQKADVSEDAIHRMDADEDQDLSPAATGRSPDSVMNEVDDSPHTRKRSREESNPTNHEEHHNDHLSRRLRSSH
uniref:Ubiquitin-like protease family profile domain-containing protein n=1 Tax=Aureoumbra lagunensis TaxID=44058 RepID=A0A7S3JWU2_9STRA